GGPKRRKHRLFSRHARLIARLRPPCQAVASDMIFAVVALGRSVALSSDLRDSRIIVTAQRPLVGVVMFLAR
ncbi:hypothetical protein Y032_1451g3880, partial [Ancylostoma ceylanicum]